MQAIGRQLDAWLTWVESAQSASHFDNLLGHYVYELGTTQADAVEKHLKRKGLFQPKMPVIDFLKVADTLGFETLGMFARHDDGQTLVMGRLEDSQIMLGGVSNNLIIDVETHRYVVKDGPAPEIQSRFFGEQSTQFIAEVIIYVRSTPIYGLASTLRRDLQQCDGAVPVRQWPLSEDDGSRQAFWRHHLFMVAEEIAISQDLNADASRVIRASRQDAIRKRWRDILGLSHLGTRDGVANDRDTRPCSARVRDQGAA